MGFNYEEYKTFLNKFELRFAPKEIFTEGDFTLLTEGRRVCVVGSRDVSDNGKTRATIITDFLNKNNIVVVSGLAKGVDTVAHETSIKNNAKTIAVVGTPLDICYPKENILLLDEIKRNHLAISQFPEGYPVQQKNFPIRNQTMALISDATIIVEASEKSGTKHQGWEALRLGRRLLIMENVAKNVSWAKDMLNYGAVVLTNKNYQSEIEDIPSKCFSFSLIESL